MQNSKNTQPKKLGNKQPPPKINQSKPTTRVGLVTNNGILKKDPAKTEENKLHNEAMLKRAVEEAIKKHSEPKKEKKKWYDSVLNSAENLIPSLLPYIPMLLGAGDYSEEDMPMARQEMPKTNTILAHASKGRIGNDVPYIHSDGVHVRVPHREYIGDVYSSMLPFVTELIRVNPGLDELVEWLGPIARQFTSYQIAGAVIEFLSLGSNFSNTAGLGFVAVGIQYNSNETPFDNKDDLLNSQFANMDKPSNSFTTWIECNKKIIGEMPKFVRSGDLPPNADINLYDHCMATLAVGGNTVNGANTGALYLCYDIDLFIPRPRSSAGILHAEYSFNNVSNSAPFSDQDFHRTKLPNSTMKVRFPNPQTFELPANVKHGRFMVIIRWDSVDPVVSVGIPDFAASVGVTIYNTFEAKFPQAATNAATTALIFFISITPSNNNIGASVTLSSGDFVNGENSSGNLTITQVPNNFMSSNQDIFDRKGRNHDEKYEEFMKLFKRAPTPTWNTTFKFDKFILKEKVNPDEVLYCFAPISDPTEMTPINAQFYRGLSTSVDPDSVIQQHLQVNDIFNKVHMKNENFRV